MKPLDAYVVEDHNEALGWIYRQIGAKRLPVEGSTLLHLDSHPDLQLPAGLRAAEAAAGRDLLPLLSIGDWIVPAVFAGHLADVVWLRPPWARQLPEGEHVLTVGETADGQLRLDARLPYFVSELMYAPAERLRGARSFRLTVVTLGADAPPAAALAALAPRLGGGPFVLDVDLDFFSTRDPFLELLPAAGVHDRLRRLFAFELGDDAEEAQARRRALLADAKAAFDHLAAAGSLDGHAAAPGPLLDGLRQLVDAVRGAYPDTEVDWQLVYDAACTFDETGLPHHVTTSEEVQAAVAQVGEVLAGLPEPAAITVARSSLDNYCPPDQVDDIQQRVLDCLRRLYPRLKVHFKYDTD